MTHEFTTRELDRLANAMEGVCRTLEKSGDFPERAEYTAIAKKARHAWAVSSNADYRAAHPVTHQLKVGEA